MREGFPDGSVLSLAASAGKLGAQVLDRASGGGILLHHVIDGLAGVDHGAVIATAESIADFLKRVFGELTGQVHRDLAGNGDIGGAAFARHVAMADLIMVCDTLLDHLDGEEILSLFHEDILQEHLGCGQIDGLMGEGGIAGDFDQGAFEPANILGDVLSDELEDRRGNLELKAGGLGPENGDAGLVIGWLDIGRQTPFETGDQAGLELLDFARATITGQDDLAALFEQVVKCVKKLLLDALFAR